MVVNSYFNPNFMVAYADGRPLSGPIHGYDGSWIFATGGSAEGKYSIGYSLTQEVAFYAAYALAVAYITFLIFYPISTDIRGRRPRLIGPARSS